MTVQKIETLVEKYFRAETTLEEERQLREWFSRQRELPPHLEGCRSWFLMLEQERQRSTSADFAERLQRKIEATTAPARVRPLWTRRLMQVAAIALVLLMAVFVARIWQGASAHHQQSAIVLAEGEIDDPELAYQQTMAALEFLTSRMETGRRKAAEEIKRVEIIDRVIKTD